MERFNTGRLALAVALVFALPACPKSPGPPKGKDLPKLNPDAGVKKVKPDDLALPKVPAAVALNHVKPMDGHDPSAKSPLLGYMAQENARWMAGLRAKRLPAYYLAYEVIDSRRVILEAEGGAVVTDSDETDRYMDVEVRVGSPRLDNRRPLNNPQQDQVKQTMLRRTRAPLGTDKLAIQNAFWIETDRRFREAVLQYKMVRVDQNIARSKTNEADFVMEKKEVYIQKPATLKYDKKLWIRRMRACSKAAQMWRNSKGNRGVATRASCRVDFELTTKYFVNSEGSQLQMSWTTSRIVVSVGVKAQDGMPLGRSEQRFARTPGKLPGAKTIAKMIDTVSRDLTALHDAPVVDPYVGPAILEGRAAGVFFHEVFGHRIEGHRQKGNISGRTFSTFVGKLIMPKWIKVYDDPTVNTLNGTTLNGFYRFDDEGVRAQRATLVDNGILRGFVMGRNPIKGFAKSNGHGRKSPGRESVSRQGNLVVEAARSVPNKKLYAQLIAEVKRQKKPFGMVFTDISGGFTNTSRFAPQAFKVNPVMAYRVYPSGKKELVRGVDIVGTPLAALGSIMSASRKVETFNGMCGAESGWVPVSASAPSLLLRQLEVERGFKPNNRSPILSPPSSVRSGGAR